jgi:hypothetical protein
MKDRQLSEQMKIGNEAIEVPGGRQRNFTPNIRQILIYVPDQKSRIGGLSEDFEPPVLASAAWRLAMPPEQNHD